MAEIIMPKMGDAMTEGKVVRWYKKAGDAVKKGEPVLEIETDKVNLDLEAEQDGTIAEVAAQEGQVIPVGGRLAMISAPGEKPAGVGPRPSAATAAEGGGATQKIAAEGGGATQKIAAEGGGATQKIAAEGGGAAQQRRVTDKKDSIKHTTGEYAEAIEMKAPRIDRTAPVSAPLRVVEGGSPRLPGQPGAPVLHEQQIPLSAMRRTIAKRLAESTGPIPHFYLTADYDVTNLMSLRQQMNEIVKISVNDFVIKAAALALRHHPNVNASWGDEAITQHGEIHIGVAVSTPEGLITPVVRNADQKSVLDIAAEVRALAEKAKNRKLMPNEYQGSTFTISNLGAWGIEEFTAIINPPNAAILAIGAAEARPVVVDRQVVVRDRMKVTMSCDHRLVDGAAGAEFLKTLRPFIEQPVRLIL